MTIKFNHSPPGIAGPTAAALAAVGAAERSRVYEDVGGGLPSIPSHQKWSKKLNDLGTMVGSPLKGNPAY